MRILASVTDWANGWVSYGYYGYGGSLPTLVTWAGEVAGSVGFTYGAPRIHADLVDEGHGVGRKRVARLMRAAGLQGVTRRKGFRTTQPDRSAPPAPDLVERQFKADGPDELWVADITYVPTWSGFLFLAVALDVWSRRVVGWAMATHLRTELVLEALAMATFQRQVNGVIHHSDRGCQYTALAFGRCCQEAGIQLSMGSTGDCFDNALAESFFTTLECELIARRRWKSPAEAESDLFRYLEGWYNQHRRHSALGQISPAEFERRDHQP